jgi:hypothetical protein
VTQLANKNERVDLEMKIKKYRRMADVDVSDELTKQRIAALVAELEQGTISMDHRRRFTQQTTLQDRISKWVAGVREEAAAMPPGRERDELLKKLRNAETAMHLKDWAESPGLQAPK